MYMQEPLIIYPKTTRAVHGCKFDPRIVRSMQPSAYFMWLAKCTLG